jgi:hypothetical protein
MDKTAYVYQLDITYPEGSLEPGWRPACWTDPKYVATMPRKLRRRIPKMVFQWPAERMFLSSSGAYGRAMLLHFYGAQVTVRRSNPVTWKDSP